MNYKLVTNAVTFKKSQNFGLNINQKEPRILAKNLFKQ